MLCAQDVDGGLNAWGLCGLRAFNFLGEGSCSGVSGQAPTNSCPAPALQRLPPPHQDEPVGVRL